MESEEEEIGTLDGTVLVQNCELILRYSEPCEGVIAHTLLEKNIDHQ